jgi:hypothetical protein
MSSLSPSRFTIERGKFFLAEALFSQHKYAIRCPGCRGNPAKPGFIKDEAGSAGGQGKARRQWSCQRSNGKGITSPCSRASCTKYIEFAQQQLEPAQFNRIVSEVCARFPPQQEEYYDLQGYQAITPLPPSSLVLSSQPSIMISPSVQPNLNKRKAMDDEVPYYKAERHDRIQQRQEQTPCKAINAMESAIRPLTALVGMSTIWAKQLELINIFLAESPQQISTLNSSVSPGPSASSVSPGPSASSVSPGPSASSVSPGPSASSVSPGPSASSVSPGPSASSVPPGPSGPSITVFPDMARPITPDHVPRPAYATICTYPPDMIIPSTYPEEGSISSSVTPHEAFLGMQGAKHLAKGASAVAMAASLARPPLSPSDNLSSPPASNTKPTPDPAERARSLAYRFHKESENREQIRMQVREQGLTKLFNRHVSHYAFLGKLPLPKKKTASVPRRYNELQCSEQR